jgi:diguanylate cyclase (GGDEF)-like protein
MFNQAGELVGFQGVDRDITERRQAEARIEYLAHHDALTGLPNRVLLRDRFEHAVAAADRTRTRAAMLFLDLDNFKVVNDTLGHVAGDKLLLEAVARLSRCTRESDTISRQGGDEFILLLRDIPEQETVERIAGEVLDQLAEPVEINGHLMNASCSIGIAMYPEDGSDFDSLLQKADAAMYNAKGAGRNTFRFYDEQMNRQAREHLLLQNRLHQALLQAEFYLQYQPQLEIDSGRVIGVEALLRWNNPDLGEVVPARFIPVAEDAGLIVQIGAWVLEEACRQGQALRQAGWPDLTMAVNLSALQFRRAGLVKTVAGALERSGLPPQLLELELTESVLLQDVENNLETVRQLKALGVRLSIDDFGTGYSSLSYLKRFAVNKLKIDRSFVRDINIDPDDAAIVRAVIQLARSLRLETIAEGVETQEQLAFLREEGCREVQGFLFSRPLSLSALRIFLREHLAFAGRAGALVTPR